eukprot:1195237-Prorocentrum_minimum.AAC.2
MLIPVPESRPVVETWSSRSASASEEAELARARLGLRPLTRGAPPDPSRLAARDPFRVYNWRTPSGTCPGGGKTQKRREQASGRRCHYVRARPKRGGSARQPFVVSLANKYNALRVDDTSGTSSSVQRGARGRRCASESIVYFRPRNSSSPPTSQSILPDSPLRVPPWPRCGTVSRLRALALAGGEVLVRDTAYLGRCASTAGPEVAPQEPEIGRRALETRGGPVHISRRRARSLRTRTAAGLDARLYAVALLKVTGVVGSIVIAV